MEGEKRPLEHLESERMVAEGEGDFVRFTVFVKNGVGGSLSWVEAW